MSARLVRQSKIWLEQAASDVRVANDLFARIGQLQDGDAGCHIALLCAQAIEKGIKAYLVLNGRTNIANHRPDKELQPLLRGLILQYPDHHSKLSQIFSPPIKATVRNLLGMTPGSKESGQHKPNTEYPWKQEGEWAANPVSYTPFQDQANLTNWLAHSKTIVIGLQKLIISVDRSLV